METAINNSTVSLPTYSFIAQLTDLPVNTNPISIVTSTGTQVTDKVSKVLTMLQLALVEASVGVMVEGGNLLERGSITSTVRLSCNANGRTCIALNEPAALREEQSSKILSVIQAHSINSKQIAFIISELSSSSGELRKLLSILSRDHQLMCKLQLFIISELSEEPFLKNHQLDGLLVRLAVRCTL